MKNIILLSACISIVCATSPNGEEFLFSLTDEEFNDIPREIQEDSILDVVGLIKKYGYPVEKHEVKTDDGYIVTVHRMYGKDVLNASNGIPVFLMHGLLSSSADWIISGPGKGLGYILADAGYDVWMGNARGNYYSKKHETLTPKNPKFWKFTWNEIGRYDVPKMIDYILEKNGREKLHYIGHSQGTTVFYVMCSERQEYNQKILSMHGLAPVAYVQNSKSPVVKYLSPYAQSASILLSLIGINQVLPRSNLTMYASNYLCQEESKFLPICTNILFILCGYNKELLNVTMLPVYMSHTPAGASSRQVVHFMQMHLSGIFRQYDRGTIGNMLVYNFPVPPRYKLKNVVAPVALHYSDNDWLADAVDVLRLHEELPNPIGLFKVPHPKFNHLDYLWAIGVKSLLYDTVLDIMKKFE